MGVLSINHRSQTCMQITRSAIDLLHQKLHIPADYTIYFVSSATEVWEIIAQSLTQRHSLHLYNGAFGDKWAEYAGRILPQVSRVFYDYEQSIEEILLPDSDADVVCLTHNETSNGTHLKQWNTILQKYPEALIAGRCDFFDGRSGVRLADSRYLVCFCAKMFWLTRWYGSDGMFTQSAAIC